MYVSPVRVLFVDCVRNVMAHAQKPDLVSRRNGRVHLNQRGASVQSTTDSRVVRISGSNAGYTMFRGSVKSTGYSLHSTVSSFTSPPVRHRVPSHFNWIIPPRRVTFYTTSARLWWFNPLNAELNPICHLLALLGAHPILHISRIRVNVAGNNIT